MSPVNRMTAWTVSIPVIIQTKHRPNNKSLRALHSDEPSGSIKVETLLTSWRRVSFSSRSVLHVVRWMVGWLIGWLILCQWVCESVSVRVYLWLSRFSWIVQWSHLNVLVYTAVANLKKKVAKHILKHKNLNTMTAKVQKLSHTYHYTMMSWNASICREMEHSN